MLAFVLFLFVRSDKINKQKDTMNIIISIHDVENGYGYSLSNNGKLLIKQDLIPVIQREKPFCNINDAQSVADLVKNRIESNKNPKITKKDLDLLEISIDCVNL